MRRPLAFVSFLLATSSFGVAHADLVPDNQKAVKLSIRVDGDVPTGQTLVLGHTFRSIDVIKPAMVAAVEWHPMAGKMQLAAVSSSAVMENVEQLRKDLDRAKLDAVFQQAKPCHDGFDGIRTIPTSAPADVIQWNYRVTFAGDKCTATLVSMQFFDKSGAEVTAKDVPNLPANVVVGPPDKAQAPAPAATTEPPKAPSAAASSEPAPMPKGACGCIIGPGTELEMATFAEKWGPLGSLVFSAMVLGLRRRTEKTKA